MMVLVLGAGCGGTGPGTSTPTQPGAAATPPGPCASWQPADALCACLRDHSLAIDGWAGFAEDDGEDDGEDGGDVALPPPTCLPSDEPLDFWREGPDEYQTLWLVQREGARARAAAAPLVGQVQGKRHVSEIGGEAITARAAGDLRYLEVTYRFGEYEEAIAEVSEATEVAHVLLCRPAPAGGDVVCPLRFARTWSWTATDERAGQDDADPEHVAWFRQQYGGHPVVTRTASTRAEVRPTGEVVLTVEGELPASLRPPASGPWLSGAR